MADTRKDLKRGLAQLPPGNGVTLATESTPSKTFKPGQYPAQA